MSNNICNDLAAHIRQVDGGNKMPAAELGYEIAMWLPLRPRFDSGELIGFVRNANPGKTMGAGALADAIVDHFDLDQED